jgi:predicted RNase H-like nuclease
MACGACEVKEEPTSARPRAVLGVDAAWTETEPSGVAAAVERDGRWTLAAVEASYKDFVARAEGKPPTGERPRGSPPVAAELLDAGRKICQSPIDLVAIDMPLAYSKITGRRCSDTKVSECYGAKQAATHSPSAERPGQISDGLRKDFEELGYPLRTVDSGSAPGRALVEVYPHPALIHLLGEKQRLQYKVAKVRKYWPDAVLLESGLALPKQRHAKLLAVWRRIVEALDRCIPGTAAALPPPDPDHKGWRLKSYEDKLDAVVCAAVAIACFEGRAEAFGDADSAIWIPRRHSSAQGPPVRTP